MDLWFSRGGGQLTPLTPLATGLIIVFGVVVVVVSKYFGSILKLFVCKFAHALIC